MWPNWRDDWQGWHGWHQQNNHQSWQYWQELDGKEESGVGITNEIITPKQKDEQGEWEEKDVKEGIGITNDIITPKQEDDEGERKEDDILVIDSDDDE